MLLTFLQKYWSFKFQISLISFVTVKQKKYFRYFAKINPGGLPQQLHWSRDVFRTQSDIHDRACFCKDVRLGSEHESVGNFTKFSTKTPTIMFLFVQFLLYGLKLFSKEDSLKSSLFSCQVDTLWRSIDKERLPVLS